MEHICINLDPTRLDCIKEKQTGADQIELDITVLETDGFIVCKDGGLTADSCTHLTQLRL